jgi:hypothetical protein
LLLHLDLKVARQREQAPLRGPDPMRPQVHGAATHVGREHLSAHAVTCLDDRD